MLTFRTKTNFKFEILDKFNVFGTFCFQRVWIKYVNFTCILMSIRWIGNHAKQKVQIGGNYYFGQQQPKI